MQEVLDRIQLWSDRFTDSAMAEQVALVATILAACWSFGTAGYKSYGVVSGAIGRWRLRRRERLEQRHRSRIAALAREVAAVLDEDAKHDELLTDLALRAAQPPYSTNHGGVSYVAVTGNHGHEGDAGAVADKPPSPEPNCPANLRRGNSNKPLTQAG